MHLLGLFFLFGTAVSAAPLAGGNAYLVREPRATIYHLLTNAPAQVAQRGPSTLRARVGDSTNVVEVTRRIALHLRNPSDLARLIAGRPLTLTRSVGAGAFILEATDPVTALNEAQRLSGETGVGAAYPVMTRFQQLHGSYSYLPNDPYFGNQWHLEHRNSDGSPAGVDLNVRAAWPVTRGGGIYIAFGDDGVEATHPEFTNRVSDIAGLDFDFSASSQNIVLGPIDRHATAVAGLALAEAENGTGGAGVAPKATLVNWKIFSNGALGATDEHLMDMYQYYSNVVSVQNHSWGYGGTEQQGPSPLESIGISNAVFYGRGGKGSVIVRSGGNSRTQGGNSDDDAYPSDPRVIAVAAVRIDGRAATYSNPGACLLVAAPSGDTGFQTLFTTDRRGSLGYSTIFIPADTNLWDYGFDSSGFSGTSGSAPQIAGVAALILSANTNLSYRDVQQILVLSSRQFDLADPDLATNGAGFRVSHNTGFGVPDAGVAVSLARTWINRPPRTAVTWVATNAAAIPDDGLRVLISDALGNPVQLASATPSLGLHCDNPSAQLPLVDLGPLVGAAPGNLTGKGALIQRGGDTFVNKIQSAANAGAAFAIIYNNTGTIERVNMGNTDFSPIPAVFIDKLNGDALHNLLLQSNVQARIQLFSTNYTFAVTNTMLCEHVGVRIQTDHPTRGEIRITVVSPAGTRSVLQRVNNDTNAGPVDWTYYTTHHFFESSVGTWRVEVSDEAPGKLGNVLYAALTIFGTDLVDSDADGLDDGWEMAKFGTLAYGPKDDPDADGFSNAQEQLMGTHPLVSNFPLQLDISRWNGQLARLSWLGSTNFIYEVKAGSDPGNLTVLTNIPGRFPVQEWFLPYTAGQNFFRVRAVPAAP